MIKVFGLAALGVVTVSMTITPLNSTRDEVSVEPPEDMPSGMKPTKGKLGEMEPSEMVLSGRVQSAGGNQG